MKGKMKKYYIVKWNKNCWDSFIQHQCAILECYKVREGFIAMYDYRENPNDSYYWGSDYNYTRKDFCFKPESKKDIFINLDKAKQSLLKKIDLMYLNRCKHLIKERDEAIQMHVRGKDNENT